MSGCAFPDKEAGCLSNGKLYGYGLDGTFALLPENFIVVKNLEITMSGRTSSTTTSPFDNYTSGGCTIGPFNLDADNILIKRDSSTSKLQITELTIKQVDPMLFGLLCKRMPMFPKLNY